MALYHINPETGNPAICRATKECRFGPASEHHATEQEARKAYEESMMEQELPKVSFKPGEIQVEPLPPGIIKNSSTAELPAGTYFVGDPCYSAGKDDAAWQEWVDVADGTSRGFVDPVFGATYNGYPVVGVNTLYGDGAYPASNGFTYGVDAGMVGLVPEELLQKMGVDKHAFENLGTWETFSDPVEIVASEDGTITFGSIAVYTGNDELDALEEETPYAVYGDEDYEEERF